MNLGITKPIIFMQIVSIKGLRCQSELISFLSYAVKQENRMPKFEFFFIIGVAFFAISTCEETYDEKYDNVDIAEVLKSERLLTNYIKCLMDEGPCTEDGRDLKDTLPDAIETDCSKCSEKQKDGSNQIMHFM